MNPQVACEESAAWVAASQLPFGNDEAQLHDHLDDLHDKLSLSVNLRRLEPCAHRLRVAQRSALRLLGDISLTAVASTPTAGVIDDHYEAAMAVLQHGRIDYRVGGRLWTAEAGRSAVFLPGEAMKVRTHHHIGVAYNLNPALLARYLQEMERSLALESVLLLLQRPWLIDLRDPATGEPARQLQLILRLLDGTSDLYPGVSILSLLQDRLYRVSAQLLLASLRLR